MAKPTFLASAIFCAIIAAIAMVSLPADFSQAQSNTLSQQRLCNRLQNYCDRQLEINERAEEDLRDAGRPMTLAYPPVCQARDHVCGSSSSSSSMSYYSSSRSSSSSSSRSSSSMSFSYPPSSSSSSQGGLNCSQCNNQPFYPVCAWNNQTYANSCYAQCYGQTVKHNGSCGTLSSSSSSSSFSSSSSSQSSFSCNTCGNQPFSPVCAWNNQTYANSCYAQCYGQSVNYNGSCGTMQSSSSSSQGGSNYPCGCSMQQNPVCGNDNRSYANSCVAQCYGQSVKHQGICQY